jgi:hypothetical protein
MDRVEYLRIAGEMRRHGQADYRGHVIRDSGWGCFEIWGTDADGDFVYMAPADTIPCACSAIDSVAA